MQDDHITIKERLEVSNKLLELNDKLYPIIQQKKWDIHPHHQPQNITSSYKHNQYAASSLSDVWLHYGRGHNELEKYKENYGENMTSLYHMRLQILVSNGSLDSELRVGKRDGSYLDRNYINSQLKNNPEFVSSYYNLIQDLEDSYRIIINGESRDVRSFLDQEDLKKYTLQDNPKHYYFNIVKTYLPDNRGLSEDNITNSIITDFENLYPIYTLFKHRI